MYPIDYSAVYLLVSLHYFFRNILWILLNQTLKKYSIKYLWTIIPCFCWYLIDSVHFTFTVEPSFYSNVCLIYLSAYFAVKAAYNKNIDHCIKYKMNEIKIKGKIQANN